MYLPRLVPLVFTGYVSAVSLTDVLNANADQLSTLNDTISRIPGVAQQLSTLNNVTLFAPSNDAFKAIQMQNANFTALASNETYITNLLLYHAVPAVITASMFNTTPAFVPTLLNVSGPGMATGASAMQKVSLQLMGAAAMIFSGFKQMSMVTKYDLVFDGGVVHVIDKILTPPGTPTETALDLGLTSFYGALEMTSMLDDVELLQDATIFAPNNLGFEAVGSAVESASETDLMNVLSYHIVKGTNMPGMPMFSSMLLGMAPSMAGMTMSATTKRHELETMSLATVAGGNLTVRVDVDNGELFINSAKIVMSDVITSNGVIHVVDNVLNPVAADAVPDGAVASQAPAFTGATAVAEAPFTSGVMPTTTYTAATMANTMAVAGAAGPFAAVPTAALVAAGGAVAMWANM
ncbi:hypothetical protein N0V93_009580 [Gnomoniopsis smithogilvyi]|uniref:FAS1 domain-containing protein n=1 Tax=Gnomoniopsis smithogilvyi TaxID=1191159 RepID=A0A9W9CTT9_9PEZI|nr:hypothetical protein N0V93_009580 [Gnomoniopsis smithogilvyi]